MPRSISDIVRSMRVRALVVAPIIALALASAHCSDPYEEGVASGDGGTATVTDSGNDGGADDATTCPSEAQRASDPNHCGSCGHSCLGGACLGGKCQAVMIGSATHAGYVRLDDEWVYATDNEGGNLVRVKKSGGNPQILAGNVHPFGLSLSATHVYFTLFDAPFGVRRVAKSGGNVDIIVEDDVGDVAFAGSNGSDSIAYSIFGRDGDAAKTAVFVAPNANPADRRTVVSGELGIETVVIDGSDLFFGQNGDNLDGAVWRASLADSKPAVKLSAVAARRLVVDANNVYFVSYSSKALMAVPRAGGATTTLATASELAAYADLATDGTYVYWATPKDGKILRTKIDGSETTELARAVDPIGIAVDDVAVYWGEIGRIMKLAK